MIANTKGQVKSTYNQVICMKLKEKYFSMPRRCMGYSSCGLRENYRILVKVRFKKVKAITVINSYEPQLPIQDSYKIKPVIVPTEMGIDLQAPPFLRILWQLISVLAGRPFSLRLK